MKLFGISIPKCVALLLIFESIVLFGGYVAASFVLLEPDPEIFFFFEQGLLKVGVTVLAIHVTLYYADLYERLYVKSRIFLLQQLCLGLAVAFFLQTLFSYLRLPLLMPKWMMVVGSVFAFTGAALLRIVYSNTVLVRLPGDKALFVGYNAVTADIAKELQENPELGYQVLGFVADEPETPGFTHFASLTEALEACHPDEIVVGVSETTHLHVFSELLDLKYRSIVIERADEVYERVFNRVLIKDATVTEMLFGVPVRSKQSITILQTLYSILISIVGAIITSPLMIATAIAVKATSRGPILFCQKRVGLNGKEFLLFKFRSMYTGSDQVRAPRAGDPRITPIGLWLRKLRLDELPQFFNVLKGDMLIVGPRPELPQLTKIYTEKVPLYQQRLLVKPGITGWAQINHKQEYSIEDTIRKLGYDLYYIRHMNLSFDLWIIFHTLKTMLLSRGAR